MPWRLIGAGSLLALLLAGGGLAVWFLWLRPIVPVAGNAAVAGPSSQEPKQRDARSPPRPGKEAVAARKTGKPHRDKIPAEWLNLWRYEDAAARLRIVKALSKRLEEARADRQDPAELPAIVKALCPGTWDRDPEVARAALAALGLTGKNVKESVLALLATPDSSAGADGLDFQRLGGAISRGGARVIPALVEALDHDDYEIRGRAAYALHELTKQQEFQRVLGGPAPDGPPGTFTARTPKKAEAIYAALDARDLRLWRGFDPRPNSPEFLEGVLTLLEALHEKGDPDDRFRNYAAHAQDALRRIGPLGRVAYPDLFRSKDQPATTITRLDLPHDQPARKPDPPAKRPDIAVLKKRLQDPYTPAAFETALELARRDVVDRDVFDALLKIHLPHKPQSGITTRFPQYDDKWDNQLGQLSLQAQKALLDLGRPLLRSEDANKRRAAAWLLAPFDTDACLPVLLASLKEDREDEFFVTLRVLGRLGPRAKKAYEPLRKQLEKELKPDDKFFGKRVGPILAALAPIDAEATVPVLMKLWREPPKHLQKAGYWPGSAEVPERAFALLRELGPRARSIIPALIDDLKKPGAVGFVLPHGNTPGPWSAANLLARIGKAAVPALQQLAGNDNADHQDKAAWVLGQIGAGAKPAVPALLKLLSARDAKVRRQAVAALDQIDPRNEKFADALIALRTDADVEVRRQVARILGGVGVRAVPTLTEALKDTDSEVRMGAASSLGHMGAKALPALREALKHKDVQVRRVAVLALGTFGPGNADAVAALIEATRDRDRLVRRLAVALLDQPSEQAAQVVPVLAGALSDQDAGVRWTAAFVLEEMGAKASAAVPALNEALKDENQDVHRRVRFALQAIAAKAKGSVE